MTEAQFRSMEQFSSNMPGAYNDLKAAEEHKKLIKEDLKKLEDEMNTILQNQNNSNSEQLKILKKMLNKKLMQLI